MWSDPEDIEEWAVSQRGAGWLFGSKVTSQFNEINGLELICRAHQLVQEGYKVSAHSHRDTPTQRQCKPIHCIRSSDTFRSLSFAT